MITPRFKLTQDDNSLSINIRAPYCSLRELDVDVDGNVFIFVCKPYYLRLNLPGKIVEDGKMKSSFDSGEFIFTYSKQYPGEHFKDLDLITKLLTPKVEASYNEGSIPIEVLSQSELDEVASEKETNVDELLYGFGFALRAPKDFVRISSTFDEVFEINPCEVSLKERRKLRLQYEQGKFNVDHYLADYIEDDEICEIIAQKCIWSDIKPTSDITFSDKELDFLKDLSNIQYNITDQQIKYCHYGLIDILFAYCYDKRSTFYEGNIESGWTIVKLAATFSWLDAFENPKEALVAAFRRSVIYPLYRHFDLSETVLQDLKILLSLDEKYIIKVLIELYDIFLKGDCCRYILNNLFIKDYIIYIMQWDKDLWRSTVQEVLKTEIKKDDLGLNLTEIEGFDLQDRFAAMKIQDEKDSSSDDTDYSSSEDSSEDSSSSEYSTDSETDSDECSESVSALEENKNPIVCF